MSTQRSDGKRRRQRRRVRLTLLIAASKVTVKSCRGAADTTVVWAEGLTSALVALTSVTTSARSPKRLPLPCMSTALTVHDSHIADQNLHPGPAATDSYLRAGAGCMSSSVEYQNY